MEIAVSHIVNNRKKNCFEQRIEFADVVRKGGENVFEVIKKDKFELGTVVFCLVKENILIFGRERDLVIYDRVA